jgi:hypothetical protein
LSALRCLRGVENDAERERIYHAKEKTYQRDG